MQVDADKWDMVKSRGMSRDGCLRSVCLDARWGNSQSDGFLDVFNDLSLLAFLSRGVAEKPRQDGLPEERNICQLEGLKNSSP